jgi:prolyl-tRNA synthetase
MCIESMMQDRKALQAGTSHFLGQNFARASGIKFQTADETEAYAWTTSWGASTRMIGGVIMTHGDDDGIILPPKVASSHLVLMPIFRKESDRAPVMAYTETLAKSLRDIDYHHRRLRVEIDRRDIGGARGWEWIKKGIPVRVEIGPRDIAADAVFMGRRDKDPKEKTSLERNRFLTEIPRILDRIQNNLYQRALQFRETHTHAIGDKDAFYAFFTPQNLERPEIHGGFALSPWCGANQCEEKIKEDLGVTIRCIPFAADAEKGACVCCGRTDSRPVIYAKAY